MNKVGSAVFDNLPLLFAVGVAIGMAKKEKEVAASFCRDRLFRYEYLHQRYAGDQRKDSGGWKHRKGCA